MRILVNNKVAEAGIKLLREEHDVDTYCSLSQQELIEIIPQYDALLVRGDTIVSSEVIEAGRNLKVIGRAGLEVEHIDIQAATKQGIVVLNAPQGNSASTIEYTLGMILALSRHIPQAYASIQNGAWERQRFLGRELKDKVLGIIGLGRIGMGVAKRAKAFDMRVIAHDPFLSEEKGRELGIELIELDGILRKSDYLTLHIPLTVDTRDMLNQDAFSKMKTGLRLINCARGGIIDEKALIWALQQGIVAGAALDAFAEGPIDPSNPLLRMENVICTPRIASRTQEAENEVAVGAARGILAALRLEPVATSLNMPPVTRDVMNTIMPYFNLMRKMCALAVALAEGRIINIDVRYNGNITTADTKLLTLTAIQGVLNPILQEDVNIVNAPEVAKERGITFREIKNKESQNFVDLISLTVKTDITEHKVAGTLFGKSDQRVVEIDDFRVEIDPTGCFLLISHDDFPGLIGKVGTILGESNINITSMQVGKINTSSRGVMIVGIDSEADAPVINRLKEIKGVQTVDMIVFEVE
ncbi:phosphoglycerate dehydrogenase [Dehalobacter sp. DCM]|uniref:phosphoglycerate dehydrogenase n=1 Tax=Dehalobacter sp. DCM TaxID=2907827 RepID=UPI003081EA19|nr:phosphoglycerate dehydrogenase [Dehalobacter sp. DCM]